MNLEELITFRKELHQYPECSGDESETAQRIANALKKLNPDELITSVGGHGIIAVYEGKRSGRHLAFRADIDALPIHELGDHEYSSKIKGIAHLCGHDGHTTILLGLASFLSQNRPESGKIYLIFQPAEEIGAGADRMLSDMRFSTLQFDYIFGLHNLPGFETNQIVVRHEIFTSASTGLIFRFTGKTSHASEPEKGLNPASIISKIILQLPELVNKVNSDGLLLATVVHCEVGAQNFGISPGKGTLSLTLRAHTDQTLEKLVRLIIDETENLNAESYKLEVERVEHFHATYNDVKATEAVENVANELGLSIKRMEEPFRWSEDFGLFTTKYPGAFFGLGIGLDSPPLHNEYYDFNDEVIPVGINMFKAIIQKLG